MLKVYNDARDAVFEELYNIALNDPNVIILTSDTSAMAFKQYRENIPKQFYNVGIAEQNMISVAAGLALAGKKVFAYGITNFVGIRCYEQIRVDICCMKLPVTIIGLGTGYVYSADGPTHHMVEDVAVLRALPNMTIWSLSDSSMPASIIHLAYKGKEPCFIRLDKGPFGNIYDINNTDFTEGLKQLTPHGDVTIVATGIMVNQALKVIEELKKHGKTAGLIDLYRLKPVNKELLSKTLKGSKIIITLEEHTVIGGIGSIVCETLLTNDIFIPVRILGIPDRFRCEVGGRETLRALDGIDVNSITNTILELTK